MLIPNNNLVAIAYKTGYCGSLMYILFGLSPEVQQYHAIGNLTFENATAHEYNEAWFNNLHDYNHSLTISEDKWNSYLTDKSRVALEKQELILFRCHPNIALKLSFIENLKVLYLTHKNRYIPERWAYEKLYKFDDNYDQRTLQKIYRSNKIFPINNIVRRDTLVRNLNHHVESYENCLEVFKDQLHEIKIDKILDCNYREYVNSCKFLKITAIPKLQFLNIINTYNSKQWKRF
jgi:hypothetical protein